MIIDIERRADLLDDAVAQDDDPVGHGHGLDLVMGDIDGRRLQPLMQFLDLGAHLHAQFGVEIGQGLVEEEHRRIAHDGAAHGDALALAAGEFARVAREIGLEIEDLRGPADLLVDLALRALRQLQREAHVVLDVHMRVERVILEDHGDVAVLGMNVVDPPAGDRDIARRSPISSPAIMRSNVDLPQPEGPSSTTKEPSAMSRSMPWMTSTSP